MSAPPALEGERPQGPIGGFLSDAGHLLSTLLDAVYTRLELLFLDLQEGTTRLLSLILWSLIGLFAAAMTLLLGALAVIFVFWDTHRILAALLLTGLFGLITLLAALVIAAKLRTRHTLFAATLEEFARDRQHLKIQS
ncbi:MAG TPA: phage holin family protein [Steroidobacteraceae bacterium]|jgi:uncharacterized membrane protein YqjE|nr:phage holin family protein [Steroidobacteraceae bacterium]